MRMEEVLLRYVACRVLRERSVEQLRVSVRVFAIFLGEEPRLGDLSRSTVHRFIDWLLANRAPDTAWNKRKDLLTLWKWSFEEGLIAERPERIKQVRKPRRDPDAWTREELRQILLATSEMPGTLPNGVPMAVFFKALVLVLYSTGLRISAALNLPNAIAADGTIYASAGTQKSNYHEQKTLQPAAIKACRDIRRYLTNARREKRLLPWPYHRNTLSTWWRRLMKHAGIEPHRRNGTQKMRRTAASWLESASPGSATRFLGHSSPELAQISHWGD